MTTNFKDVSETPKNRFVESKLGKQAASNHIYDSGIDVDKSLADVFGKKRMTTKTSLTRAIATKFITYQLTVFPA